MIFFIKTSKYGQFDIFYQNIGRSRWLEDFVDLI